MYESHSRSVIKALSWRVLATFTTIIIVFILTGKLVLSLSIGFLEVFFKSAFYYLHERAWDKVGWGHTKKERKGISSNI